MPRNEKGSLRGSSDQRGEHPGYLHNCRISEHGLQTWAPHRGLLLSRPGAPGRSGERGGCRPCSRGERTEACPGHEIRRWPGPEQGGCWGTAAVPDGRKASGAPKGRERPGARPSGARVPGGCCRCGGGAAGDRLLAPTRRYLRRRASTLPPRRLAGGSRPGGSQCHQRAGIKGLNGTLLPPGSSLPLPSNASPAACTPGPAALPSAGPGSGEAPGAPAVAHCSRNQPGLPPAPAVLGATGFAATATGKGMPGDTLFSHFKTAKLASRRGCPVPPSSLRSLFYARTILTEMRGFPPP